MKSNYESIFIIKPTLSDEETEKVIQKMRDIITSGGGEVVNVENWGKKKLAYEIKKHKKGHYVLLHFKGEGPIVKELERNYRLSDLIIKFLTVKLKGDFVPPSQKTQPQAGAASQAAPFEEAKLAKHVPPAGAQKEDDAPSS
ncbi:MAG: 30S ribosomal protein S6 [Nitrospirae bacterium]|nr:30S ribosomal protein S6 [Nitrospirota bacterium]